MISPIREGSGPVIGDARAEPQQASPAQSRLLANMSHEIRTPLNAMVGMTYLLGLSTLDASQADMVSKLRIASRSLLRVIDDLLDLSKIDAGELTLVHAPFLLLDLLSELKALAASNEGIRFSIDTPADLPLTFDGDAGCIKRVLAHLVTNALKFTHEGSVTLSVKRLASTVGSPPGTQGIERLLFSVTDSGIGIAAEDAARIFAPFVQVDDSCGRRYGGAGLGLSIVERLVALMGGSVGFESRPGTGSSFWFELGLPVVDSRRLALEAAATPECRDLQGMQILIADDSEINLEVASRILKAHGAQTTLVRDGLQAVDLLQQRPRAFDAVLMDIQMPVLDGREATRCIREQLGLVQLPIIALSAGALIHEQEGARRAGMNGFVRKPFDPHDLVRTLLRHVRPLAGSRLPTAAPEPCAQVWPEIAGIDTADVRARLGDDVDLFGSMLRRLLTEFANIGEELSGAGSPDGASLAHLAARSHKLKGSASTLGATAISRLAERAENACRHHRPGQAREAAQALAAHLRLLEFHSADLLERMQKIALREEAFVEVDDNDAMRLVELLAMLSEQSMDALACFAAVAPRLRQRLGDDAFSRLEDQVTDLQFEEAAKALWTLVHESGPRQVATVANGRPAPTEVTGSSGVDTDLSMYIR